MSLRLVSRDSFLAMAQTISVDLALRKKQLSTSIAAVKTLGDIKLDGPLYETGQGQKEGKAFFTKELEDALLAGKADLAVHSLKDLPTDLPPGLQLASLALPAEKTDTIITRARVIESDFLQQWQHKTFATSSLRRMAQLKYYFKDCQLTDMRGNIITRLEKFIQTEKIDALVLATAGLKRMLHFYSLWQRQADELSATLAPALVKSIEKDHERITRLLTEELFCYQLDPSFFMPAVAQGMLGLETPSQKELEQKIVNTFQIEPQVLTRINIERQLLSELGAGCHLPLGVHAERDKLNENSFRVRVFYSDNYGPGKDGFAVTLLDRYIAPEEPVYLQTLVNELKSRPLPLVYTGQRPGPLEKQARAHEFYHLPLVKSVPLADSNFPAGHYDTVVVTSRNAARLIEWQKITCRQVVAVGPQTAAAIEPTGIPVVIADDFNSLGAAEKVMATASEKRVLWLGAKSGIKDGIQLLQQSEFQVTDFSLYENKPVKHDHLDLNLDQALIFVFTSPSTVRSYLDQKMKRSSHLYSALGPTTATEMKKHGLFAYHISSKSEVEVLAQELRGKSCEQEKQIEFWSLNNELERIRTNME